jgi:hypothetical protein
MPGMVSDSSSASCTRFVKANYIFFILMLLNLELSKLRYRIFICWDTCTNPTNMLSKKQHDNVIFFSVCFLKTDPYL